MGKYTDYVMKIAQDLLAVPSPSGFTHMAAEFVKEEFENLGYKPQITQKGVKFKFFHIFFPPMYEIFVIN